mgnify:CR=1 FL=1
MGGDLIFFFEKIYLEIQSKAKSIFFFRRETIAIKNIKGFINSGKKVLIPDQMR